MTSATASDLGFLTPPTVLIVDDDPEMRDFLSFAVEPWARVLTAGSGREGIDLCRSSLPDLVLLDVNMPGLDGFDVINELKHDSSTRHIPVMFITGETFAEVESECLEAGAADYVAKPINTRVLTARARTHVLLKQQSDLLSDLAIVDGLTGAMTRAAFDIRLAQEFSRSHRSGHPFALGVISIEELDSYAETYGHLAADDVVAAVAGVARGVARRQSDLVCRFGASELAVLLPDLSRDAALPQLSGVTASVTDLKIPHRLGRDGQVRVSVRLVDAGPYPTLESLLAAAAGAPPLDAT